FDKLGRVVRTIANYIPQGSSDPADWEWVTDHWEDGASNAIDHGVHNDQNRIVDYQHDAVGRQTRSMNPEGNTTATTYDQTGRMLTITDPEGMVTLYRYDG